jgi:hypothetical protein
LPSPTKEQIIELFLLTNFVKEAKQSMTNKRPTKRRVRRIRRSSRRSFH